MTRPPLTPSSSLPVKDATVHGKPTSGADASLLKIVERVIAFLMVISIFGLHVINRMHVGALWRDEINSVNMAALPTFSELWQNAEFDSVPVLWLAFLQKLTQLGFASDDLFRDLGLGVGLAILVVLWMNARTFKYTFPFLTLALLGLSAIIIRYGDSLRVYGLGIIPILLTLGLVWKFITAPSKKNFALATIAAILSVHLHFHNDVQIFAICCGASVATATQKRWKTCMAALGIGAVAAASMLVYIPVIQREFSWFHIALAPSLPLDAVVTRAGSTLALSGSMVPWLWAFLFAGFLFFAVVGLVNTRVFQLSETQRALLVYSLATLLLSTVCTALFLQHMRVSTTPWHYTGWMAVAAACLEAGFSTLGGSNPKARIAKMALPVLVLLFTFGTVFDAAKIRLTNYDAVARLLTQKATPRDYILVNPWEQGITFNRYYNGEAKWDTIPAVTDHRFHRYDLVKAMMTLPEPAEAALPILQKVEATLKNGGRLWLIGGLPFLPEGSQPPKLPTAPNSPYKWYCKPYSQSWLMQVAYFVQTHSLRAATIPIDSSGSVSKYETATLIAVEGWHD